MIYDIPAIFSKVEDGSHFIEEFGIHSVVWIKIEQFTNEYDRTLNARWLHPGKPHYEYFETDEQVRIADELSTNGQ